MSSLASGSKANAEVDLYAGFIGDAADIDYAEATGSVGMGPATVSLSYTIQGEADALDVASGVNENIQSIAVIASEATHSASQTAESTKALEGMANEMSAVVSKFTV